MTVTFRLSVDQFRTLLIVVMADDVTDDLSNAVLMACTRPHGGIVAVPLSMSDGHSLAEVVDSAAVADSDYFGLAGLIRSQLDATLGSPSG